MLEEDLLRKKYAQEEAFPRLWFIWHFVQQK